MAEADACKGRGEVGALLRREGLYSSHLDKWRLQRQRGVLRALATSEQVEQELSRLGDQPWLVRVVNNTGVFLQALGRPAEAYVSYHRAAKLYMKSRERPYACSALINCVDALLDEGKLVEASAVLVKSTRCSRIWSHRRSGCCARSTCRRDA